MAKAPRNALKTYFQSGNRPASMHFEALIDSFVHVSDDQELLGLREHNSSRIYYPGDTVIREGNLYSALNQTNGAFVKTDWQLVQSANTSQNSNTDNFLFAESLSESFMIGDSFISKVTLETKNKTGLFRCHWSAVVHHKMVGGLGSFRLIDVASNAVLGRELTYRQNDASEKIAISSFVNIELLSENQTLALQYISKTQGYAQHIEHARIELFKIKQATN